MSEFAAMKQTRIVFVLLPKVQMLDLAGAAQVFYEATELGNGNFKLHFASVSPEVTSAQGLALSPVCRLQDLSLGSGDFVCVPGVDFNSFLAGEMDSAIAEMKPWMWAQQEKGVFIGSICSGALALGKLGMLDGVECTCHWKCLAYMRDHFPKAWVRDNRLYVFDKNIFTSAGMTAGIDMSLALVEKWRNPLLAAKVAQEMVINVRRADTKEQKNTFLDFKNHFNPEVYRAQEVLANRLDARFTIGHLAQEMNMSARHLTRLFKSHTGQTVQAYRDGLRLAHGEQLLLHTERSIKEIALECGFENRRQFMRLWKQKKGIPPGGFRKTAVW